MTQPNAISFSNLDIDVKSGRTIMLSRCGQCFGIVLPEDNQAHADWHGALTSSVRVSGMGFGAMGGLI